MAGAVDLDDELLCREEEVCDVAVEWVLKEAGVFVEVNTDLAPDVFF